MKHPPCPYPTRGELETLRRWLLPRVPTAELQEYLDRQVPNLSWWRWAKGRILLWWRAPSK